MAKKPNYNLLKDEKSIFLNNRKDDLVHWHRFGVEALDIAQKNSSPIFLFIGSAADYMCDELATESFLNEEIAAELNGNFVCIIVDRDEFPDLATLYSRAALLYGHEGILPITAFLMPDMKPYYVGNYFPAKSDGDQTGLYDIIKELASVFKNDKDNVIENANKAWETLQHGSTPKESVSFDGHFPHPMAVMNALKEFQDSANGGYGPSPRFPNFSFYEWALEQMLEGMIDEQFGKHIIFSLEKMLMGGIVDHVRGGIHNSSRDANWQLPTFEKYLYNQAALLKVLAKMGLLYPSPIVFDSIIKMLDYLQTEMLGESGNLFSSQSGTSEGTPGLYFCFSEEEFEHAVMAENEEQQNPEIAENIDKIKKWFNITKDGNYTSQLNTIKLNHDFKEEIFTPKSWDLIRKVYHNLLSDRKLRIPPITDNKSVASANLLVLSSLTDVVQYCSIDVIRRTASQLFNKILDGFYDVFLTEKPDGGKTIIHTNTRSDTPTYLEDYVFFAEVQLRTYEITANEVFKKNFLDTLTFITKEFIDGEQVTTRRKRNDDVYAHLNLDCSPFDGPYRSAKATLIAIARRGAALFDSNELLDQLEKAKERLTHDVLKNPYPAGEALRALTYPDNAYKVLTVPGQWTSLDKFIKFTPYFMPRFVLNYHNEKEQWWKIVSQGKCELQGSGIDELVSNLTPKENEANLQ